MFELASYLKKSPEAKEVKSISNMSSNLVYEIKFISSSTSSKCKKSILFCVNSISSSVSSKCKKSIFPAVKSILSEVLSKCVKVSMPSVPPPDVATSPATQLLPFHNKAWLVDGAFVVVSTSLKSSIDTVPKSIST